MELAPAHGPLAAPPNAPGRNAAVVLTVTVHVLLAVLLIYGIRWQTQLPESVAVELVSAVPLPPTFEPQPPPPEPVQKAEPKPEPKPVPPPPKPDIAVKEKEKPKPPPPKEAPPPKPNPFAEHLKRDTEQLQRQRIDNTVAAEFAEIDKLKADQAAAARAVATWSEKIAGRIKNNIVRPPGATGNPEAIFEIALLPDGSLVADPKLRKSTGNAALDAAIERAIRKSSPLPKPDDPSAFRRELVLKFRPLDN